MFNDLWSTALIKKKRKKNRFEHKQKHVCLSLKKPCALQRSTCLLFEVHCCFVWGTLLHALVFCMGHKPDASYSRFLTQACHSCNHLTSVILFQSSENIVLDLGLQCNAAHPSCSCSQWLWWCFHPLHTALQAQIPKYADWKNYSKAL